MKAEVEKSTNTTQSQPETEQTEANIDSPSDGATAAMSQATTNDLESEAAPASASQDTIALLGESQAAAAPSPTTATPGAWQPRLKRFGERASEALGGLSLDDRLGRIILSVVLAVILWLYVTSLENPSQATNFRSLTIDVREVGPSLKLVNNAPVPGAVDVSFQAPQNVLSTLQTGDIRPYIDLSGLGAGVHRVPIELEIDAGVGNNLSNLSVTPPDTQVLLEVQETRAFPVEVRIIGAPAIGYLAEQPQVEPSQISVTGSENAVSRIASVNVAVDVDEKATTQRGFRTPIALDSAGQEISGLTFTPISVQVTVPIKGSLGNRLVPVRVPIEGNPAAGYSVEEIRIEPSNVTLCCAPTNILEEIVSVSTAPVSISGTTSTVITSTQLILPAGVQLFPGQSDTITVTISVNTFNTTWQMSVSPVVEGLSPGFVAVLSPTSIDLTLSGTFAQFQALTPSDVRAVINAEGLGAGTYELTPVVTVPNDITLVTVNPPAVTVSIIAPTPVPPTPTNTPVPQPTATATPIPTATSTPVPALPTDTPTPPPPPTDTPTVSPTDTGIPPTPTETAPLPTPTATLLPPTTPTPTPGAQ